MLVYDISRFVTSMMEGDISRFYVWCVCVWLGCVCVCVWLGCCLICALQAICTCFFLSMCLTRVCLAHYVRVLWYFCRFLLFSWLFGFVCLLFSKTVFVFYKIVRLLSTFESFCPLSTFLFSKVFPWAREENRRGWENF